MDAITKAHILTSMKIHAGNSFSHILNEERGYAHTRRANLSTATVERTIEDFRTILTDMIHEVSQGNDFQETLQSLIPFVKDEVK